MRLSIECAKVKWTWRRTEQVKKVDNVRTHTLLALPLFTLLGKNINGIGNNPPKKRYFYHKFEMILHIACIMNAWDTHLFLAIFFFFFFHFSINSMSLSSFPFKTWIYVFMMTQKCTRCKMKAQHLYRQIHTMILFFDGTFLEKIRFVNLSTIYFFSTDVCSWQFILLQKQ